MKKQHYYSYEIKPVVLYLAIAFFMTVSCPYIRKDNTTGNPQKSVKSESSAGKIPPSNCEEKIRSIPLITEKFAGTVVPAILEKSERLYDRGTDTYPINYRTKITNAVDSGVNFAGKYIVAEWGVGTDYQSHAIINGQTGRIISFGLKSNEGVDFSISSPVLIINPKRNFLKMPDHTEAQTYASRLRRYYYQVENDSLILVCSEPANAGW